MSNYVICHECSHIHERREWNHDQMLTWVAGCWCGCVASGSDYFGLNIPLDDYKPRTEPLPATVRPAEPAERAVARSGWAEWFRGLVT